MKTKRFLFPFPLAIGGAVALSTFLLGALAPAARADTVAFTTSGSGTVAYPTGNTLGYTFTLANATRVTQLGFYDAGADGLTSSGGVPVTIWNSSGTILSTATVPAGTTVGEISGYLYTSLATPVTLAAGTYTIGAYATNNSDSFLRDLTTVTPATGITFGTGLYGGGNVRPTQGGAPNGYFGPNFEFSNVPEPATWLAGALLVGGAGLTLRRRRSAVPHT